jgi:hypothetical protein
MKLTTFSLQNAHNVTGLPAMGVRHLSIGDTLTVQWTAGDAIRHYEVQPDCETLHEVALFKSVFASSFGEFAGNVSFPDTAKVAMLVKGWADTQTLLASLPESILSVDIHLDGTDRFIDDGAEVDDVAEYSTDCLQFQCYRFVKYGTEWTFYLVLAAKYHDTYVRYELAQEGV